MLTQATVPPLHGEAMTDDKQNDNNGEAADLAAKRQAEAAAAQAAHEAALAAEAGDRREGFSDPVAFLSAELDKMEAEKNEANDKALRLVAEMDNLRKRTARDVHDARTFSIAGFARDMLEVSDNLRRALAAVPDGAAEGDPGLKALVEGVEMTERAMLNALEKHGVKKISPKGEKFDPNLHQAMFEVPNPEVPNNTVLEVVQEGFVIGERCLRPAMVGVAKGGPKEAPKPEGNAEAGQAEG